jgi:predicted phage terminase large subunit-like protein
VELAKNSLYYFAVLYFPHYFKNRVPQFHVDIYEHLQNDDVRQFEVIAFRGSAKSTIASLIYPIWCAIFKKKNFIILCSDTHIQAKQIISNLIFELEHNEHIIRDFGTFKDPREDWTATNIHLKNEVRIMSRSRGQKFRGLRHLENRPDLIVLDDIENIDDVRTKEQRDKTEEWYASDVVPTLDTEVGKLVIIGNMLHNDSLLSRIKNRWRTHNNGIVKEYPLINDDGENLWAHRYPFEKVEELKTTNLRFFQREYLLKIVAAEDQLVKRVGYYDRVPELERVAIGVDLAISKSQTADYTSINVCGEGRDGKLYNLKNYYGKWNFNEVLEKAYSVYNDTKIQWQNQTILLGMEDVAYQKSAIEEFYRRYRIQPIAVKQTKDKRARVETMVPYLENDQILFKHEGMDELINQLLNFGIERYDDCVDAAEISWRLILNAEKPAILWL